MTQLLVYPHKKEPLLFELQRKRTRLGRDFSNSLVLEDRFCSLHHAEIYRLKIGYVIRDLNTKNGTYINGCQIADDTVLNGDDRILIGETSIIFTSEARVPPKWPQTVEEAADFIIYAMNDREKRRFRETKIKELFMHSHDWGTDIRIDFGLGDWKNPIFISSRCIYPEDCRMKIAELIWQKLQEN